MDHQVNDFVLDKVQDRGCEFSRVHALTDRRIPHVPKVYNNVGQVNILILIRQLNTFYTTSSILLAELGPFRIGLICDLLGTNDVFDNLSLNFDCNAIVLRTNPPKRMYLSLVQAHLYLLLSPLGQYITI